MWNKLSMADRAKYIKLGVQNGITDINTIRDTYNSYTDGGYTNWINKIKEWRPGIEEDIDAENPSYDYRGFYNEDPDRAWSMLNNNSNAHFTDKYKKPNHPTFSDESIYSNDYTKGGHWKETLDGKSYYIPSEYTGTKERLEETRDYLTNTGEGYIDYNGELRFPFAQEDREEYNIWLPEIEVNSKYSDGGYTNNDETIVKRKSFLDDILNNEYDKTGMMKAKLALASHFGNPTARRITNYDTRSYKFDDGRTGNVYVGSYDNLVTPQIQDVDGELKFIDNPWSKENEDRSYKQSLIFDTPEDAEYFGEHYKEIAPMMNLYNKYSNGGKVNKYDGTSTETQQIIRGGGKGEKK